MATTSFQPTVSTQRHEVIVVDDRTPQVGVVAVDPSPIVETRARLDAVLQRRADQVHEIAAQVLGLAMDVELHTGDFGQVRGLDILAAGQGTSRVAWSGGGR